MRRRESLGVVGGAADRIHQPLISVVIPALNEEVYISQCLDSFARQTIGGFELIVVNDGSTDATRRIVSGNTGGISHLSLISNDKTLGLPGALNQGLLSTRGDLLTWVSADNFVSDDFLERLSTILLMRPDIDIVYGDTAIVGADGRFVRKLEPIDIGRLAQKNVLRSCFMFKRKVFDSIGPYRDYWFTVEDFEFWLRCEQKHLSFCYVPGPVVYHRQHELSLTSRFSKRIARLDLLVRSVHLRRCADHAIRTSHIAQLTRDIVKYNQSRRSLGYALRWSFKAPRRSRPLIWCGVLWQFIRMRLRTGRL